ncbi:penicillin-binding transpeptidase domain-containing protein [Streptomyces cheonanensis]|uniref:Penicillin-binding transpeptidase domain-containing protein n=1 Tax=Streptomyces cheonanensis TaxID=312720 RepID=A0ABP5GLG7_9ACTN
MTHRTHSRGGRRPLLLSVSLLVVLLAATGVMLGLRGDGTDPDEAARAGAQRFLDAWAAGEPERAAAYTDDPEAARSLLESVATHLRAEDVEFAPAGPVTAADGEDGADGADARTVPFTATFTLPGLGDWSYASEAVLRPGGADGGWQVAWRPALVHPELGEEQTLVLNQGRGERAPVLAADGSELAGPGTVWEVSIWPGRLTDRDAAWAALDALDAGIDTDALAGRVAAAGEDEAVPVVTLREAAFEEHAERLRAVPGLQFAEGTRQLTHAARAVVGAVDPGSGAGVSGLEERYDERLAGTASAAVVIADRASGAAVETLHAWEGGEPGEPVVTTLDPAAQRAAEEALADAGREGAIVALRPSTGEVLAAADWPADGFSRSLSGQLAPGSTFKVVTAAALLEGGMTPQDVVGCPRYVTVNGFTYENQDEFELAPDTTLREAFAASCNTALIEHRDRFADDTLHTTAQAFGIGAEWRVGASTFDGGVPVAGDENELAASLIGQGRVQASPLVMASVAATVADGTFRQPVLVPDAAGAPHEAPTTLAPATVEALRSMMRATVTEGSASALAGVPGLPHGKTGTAEFETADGELSTNAWIIGYLGERDVAFAVVLEDGGSGGRDAGPVAAAFLTALEP